MHLVPLNKLSLVRPFEVDQPVKIDCAICAGFSFLIVFIIDQKL